MLKDFIYVGIILGMLSFKSTIFSILKLGMKVATDFVYVGRGILWEWSQRYDLAGSHLPDSVPSGSYGHFMKKYRLMTQASVSLHRATTTLKKLLT